MDITGNWYEDIQKTDSNNYSYTEIFIDDESFNIYHAVAGFSGHIDYIIENNIFYYVFLDNVKKEQGKIEFIDKNTISIGDRDMVLKRITIGLKLEGLLRNNKSEDEYLKFFNERKTAWKKNHGKD
jgi:hypothetical protein